MKREIRLAKRVYSIHGAKHGGKFFWDNIKMSSGLGRQKTRVLPRPASNDEQARNSVDKINKYFIESVANIIQQAIINMSAMDNVLNIANNVGDFEFEKISVCDTIKSMRKLPKNKSSGIDNISMLMVKKSTSYIVLTLTEIFNRSLQTGVFPAY